MLHKTGSRAVEAEGLTTQQWAVLGALSREKAQGGMSMGDLARYLIRKHLSDMPVQVIETNDAIEGLERARHERPQVIILDLMMPEVSGFETLDELKADWRTRDIPVVIHTSMSLPDRDKDLLAQKAFAVLDKNSIDTGKLKAVIAEIVHTLTK